jgi:hypothetical protein
MLFFKKWYKDRVTDFVNFVLKFEKEQNIRADFLNYYESSLKLKGTISRAYSTKPKRWYYDRIIEWGKKAKNYDPFKNILKSGDAAIDEVETVSNLFTLFDAVRAICPLVPTVLAFLSKDINEYLSGLFLLISVGLLIINWIFEIFRLNYKAVRKIINQLTFIESDFLLEDKTLPEKSSLYGPYIWNRSLCNPSTISAYLFVIFLKRFMPISYNRVKNAGLNLIPQYMKTITPHNPYVSRLGFILFNFRNRKSIK